LRAVVDELNHHHKVRALAGVELTHVPPELINDLTLQARDLGADIVVVHGETIVEPVPPGTNRAAIEAGVDLLAHPGLITAGEVALAAENGVHLEISARKGHSLGNGRMWPPWPGPPARFWCSTPTPTRHRTSSPGLRPKKWRLGAGMPGQRAGKAFRQFGTPLGPGPGG
jgi:hypothetical protein